MTRVQFLLLPPLVVFLIVFGGTTLWSQEWEQVAVLVSDVSRDETELTVEFIRPVTLDRQILIEGIVTLIVLGRKGPHGFPFRRPHSHFPIH